MSYIDNNLLPDEKILFRTKKHIIIFFIPLVLTIFFMYTHSYLAKNPILAKIEFVPWLIALIFWAQVGLDYITSEFVVTNKRIMMREGFFFRHTTEMRIATISQVYVGQSLLGQILDYGIVTIQAFGASDAFSMIAKPYVFQKYVNEQIDKIATKS